jgi:hypothetical protein
MRRLAGSGSRFSVSHRSTSTKKPRPPSTTSVITVKFTVSSPAYFIRLSANGEKPALQKADTEWNRESHNAWSHWKSRTHRENNSTVPAASAHSVKTSARVSISERL